MKLTTIDHVSRAVEMVEYEGEYEELTDGADSEEEKMEL